MPERSRTMADKERKINSEQAEAERLAKIDKLDSNQKRKKLIFAAVTVFLISLFVFGTIFGGKYILSYEGTQEMPTEEVIYEEIPETASQAVTLVDNLMSAVKDKDSVKLSKGGYFSLEREDIIVESGFEGAEDYIDIIRDYVKDAIADCYEDESYEEGFGNDFTAQLPDLSYIGLAKTTVTEDEENPALATVCFTSGKEAEDAFVPENTDEIKQKIVEAISSMANIKDDSFDYDSFNIYFTYDRDKNELNSIKTERVLTGKFTLSFTGVYAEFGEVTVSFKAKIGDNYSFDRVSFSINSDEYMVEKGDSDEIKHSVNSDESPADIEITWTSSDESVLTIDGNFYKAHKVSDTPVKVTGTYTYLGRQYSDECLFYVRVPVESIKLNVKTVELEKAGDQAQLDAKVKPTDATFRDVRWFSSDENIAIVDENGVITAVAPGTTTVYAITVDGNYKKSCTVTVNE